MDVDCTGYVMVGDLYDGVKAELGVKVELFM